MMPWLAKWIATAGGAGYSPVAPGTVGSLVGLLLGLASRASVPWVALGLLVVTGLIGVAASTITERSSGVHDPSFVVVDEVWGMWAVVIACPFILQGVGQAALAFGLFRLFDVLKPPPLKWLAKAPEGWGIMLDDVGAAAYTILLLRIGFALTH